MSEMRDSGVKIAVTQMLDKPSASLPALMDFSSANSEDLLDAGALAERAVDALMRAGWRPAPSAEQVAAALDEATSSFGTGFWATSERDHLVAEVLRLWEADR